ncbi:MAG: oligosaccharide flippase family protein [Pseudomonadota bacterium]
MTTEAEPPKPGVLRGFFVSVGSLVFARAFVAVSQIIVLPIIARQLTVEEFAIMAMAMTVVIFSSVLSDAGLGRSLIRTDDYNALEWTSVFWLLVGLGVFLGGSIALTAPMVASFYDQPDLVAILAVLALVPFLQAVSAVPNAEIERRENYAALARLQVISTGLSLSIAVGMALTGFGVWALVGQQLSLAVFRNIGLAALTRFRPSAAWSWPLVRGHLGFARDSVGTSIIAVVQTQAAVVAIARFLGDGALGLFAMSQRFTRLPQFGLAGPMSSVVYVRMAKAKHDPQRVVDIYMAALRLLALVLIPPLTLIAVAGEAIFTFLLSEEWRGMAVVFAYSIPGITFESIAAVCLACIFRAMGRTELHLRLVVEGAITMVILATIAAQISLEAVAFAFTLWGAVYVFRAWTVAARIVPLSIGRALAAIVPSALAAGSAGLAHRVVVAGFEPTRLVEIAVAVVLTLACYGALFLFERRRVMADVQVFRA